MNEQLPFVYILRFVSYFRDNLKINNLTSEADMWNLKVESKRESTTKKSNIEIDWCVNEG